MKIMGRTSKGLIKSKKIQFQTEKVEMDSLEVKYLYEKGGKVFDYLFSLLTDSQKETVNLFLSYDAKLMEVLPKW